MEPERWWPGIGPRCEHCAGWWDTRPPADVALVVGDGDAMAEALGHTWGDTGERLYLCLDCYRLLHAGERREWQERAAAIRRGDEPTLAPLMDDDESEALREADERWLAETYPRYRSELEQAMALGLMQAQWTRYGADVQRARRSFAQPESPTRPARRDERQKPHWWDRPLFGPGGWFGRE